MPYKLKVIDYKSVYLLSEIISEIIVHKEYGIYPRLKFTVDYIPEEDENGESPPRYLIDENLIYDLVNDELECMNESEEYEIYEDLEYEDIELSTIYVLNNVYDEITKDKLKSSKMTRITVPIQRKIDTTPMDEDSCDNEDENDTNHHNEEE
jgi:hypothetical protein